MPQTIAELLESYGPPSQEICIDWGWQILDLPHARFPQAAPSPTKDAALTWSQLRLAADGLIAPAFSSSSLAQQTSADPTALLQQLLGWAGPAGGARPECDCRSDFVQALIELQSPATAITQTTSPASAVDSPPAQTPNRESQTNVPGVLKLAKTPSTERVARKSVTAICGIVVAAVGLVAIGIFGRSYFVEQDSGQLTARQSAAVLPASGTAISPADNVSQVSPLSTGPAGEVGELETTQSLSPLGMSESPDVAVPNSAGSGLSQLEQFSFDGRGRGMLITEGGTPEDSKSTHPPDRDPPDGVEAMDVAAEMDKLAVDLPLAAESDVKLAALPSSPNGVFPAIVVTAFPAIQVQKVAIPRALRMREPVWSLQVVIPDGVAVLPDEPQMVSARQPAIWRVTGSKQNPAEDTQVLIRLSVVGSRGESLRWNIAAISPQAPQIVLPLSRPYLNKAQDLLANFRTRLQVALDNNKLSKRSQGNSKEMRSYLAAQSKLMTQQLKLTETLLKLVVDASKLEALIDGQFEVHGHLADASGRSSAELTFGSPPLDSAQPDMPQDD